MVLSGRLGRVPVIVICRLPLALAGSYCQDPWIKIIYVASGSASQPSSAGRFDEFATDAGGSGADKSDQMRECQTRIWPNANLAAGLCELPRTRALLSSARIVQGRCFTSSIVCGCTTCKRGTGRPALPRGQREKSPMVDG